MSDQDRRFGDFESIKCSAVAAMCDVDGHPHPIHPIDYRNAEVTDSVVASLRAPVADQVTGIIREQRHPLPQLIETIDIVWGSKMLRVLQTKDNADFAGSFRSVDACRVVHAYQVLSMMRNKSIPQTEEPHHLVV